MPPLDEDDQILSDLRMGAGDAMNARIGRIVRSLEISEVVPPLVPPPELWGQIAAELPFGEENLRRERPATVVALPAVPYLRHRVSGPRRAALAVLSVAAAVAAFIGVGQMVGGSDVVATIALAPVDGPGGVPTVATGTAKLVRRDGALALDLRMPGIEPVAAGEYYEVWLLDREVRRLVSLGPVRPGERYVVPVGLDPSELPIVDVSVERLDGNPGHSGASLLRGTFDL